MKIFDIFFDWLKGLWATGGIFGRFIAFIGVTIGNILLLVAIIINFGLRLFKIFWDESLFYSTKGYRYIKEVLTFFNSLLSTSIYYFFKLLSILIPSKNDNIKPGLNARMFFIMVKDIFCAILYYLISLLIFLISIYWILTLFKLVSILVGFLLSWLNLSNDLFIKIAHTSANLEIWSEKAFSINYFNFGFIWLIRLVGFSLIFSSRFLRIKAHHSSLELSDIVPYRKPFWENQIEIRSSYRHAYSIGFFVLFSLLLSSYIYFNTRVENNTYEKKTTRKSAVDMNLSYPSLDSNENKRNVSEDLKTHLTDNNTTSTKNSTKFRYKELEKSINSTIIYIKANEKQHAINMLTAVLNNRNIPTETKEKLPEVLAFIKGQDYADALTLLYNLRTKIHGNYHNSK